MSAAQRGGQPEKALDQVDRFRTYDRLASDQLMGSPRHRCPTDRPASRYLTVQGQTRVGPRLGHVPLSREGIASYLIGTPPKWLSPPQNVADSCEGDTVTTHPRPFVGVSQKSIFKRPCRFLAMNTHKMAPRTSKGLQERAWDAPT